MKVATSIIMEAISQIVSLIVISM